jgi:hypothetical protein
LYVGGTSGVFYDYGIASRTPQQQQEKHDAIYFFSPQFI